MNKFKIIDSIIFSFAIIFLIAIFPRHGNQAEAQSTSNSPTVDQIVNMENPNTVPLVNNMLRQQSQATSILQGYFNSNGILSAASGGTGANITTNPNGSLLVYNSSNVGIGTFGQGTSGQFLQSKGTSLNPSWTTTTWVPNNIQVFTTTGTWTKPSYVSNVYVKVWGAGGNGGNGGTGLCVGGGGAQGGYSEGIIAVTGNVSVTIGATNSFAGSTTIQATAGSVGTAGGNGANCADGIGGTGGVGSNGSINTSGANGTSGYLSGVGAGQIHTPGLGGGSFLGMGGMGAAPNATGSNGDAGAVVVYY